MEDLMIINVTVENFWSINEQLMFNLTAAKRYKEGMTIPVEKYKMNVLPLCAIYGANGSGKSNLVRAIRLMRDKVVHKSEIAVVPFKFDSEQNEMKPSRFSILFLDKEGEMYQYGFSAIGSDIQDEWLSVYRTQRETMLFERSPSDDSQ
ncbi:MAG: AAA family ATPase, partial [Sphaerochaetaceae bacterium]